jgi:thiamine kinase-like enzyme
MTLNSQNICHYLLSNKLVALQSVVEGDLLIRDTSSRNTIFLVNQFENDGVKLLIKQPDIEDKAYVNDMKIEADIYAFIHTQQIAAKLRPFIAKLCHYDTQQHILVLEQLMGVCRVYDYLYYGQHLPDKAMMKSIAKILANFHQIKIKKYTKLPDTFPWIFDATTPKYIRTIKNEDKHAYQFLQPFYDDVQVLAFMQSAKAMWQPTAFVHSDARFINFMMPYAHQPNKQSPFWAIDLEMAGMGDAAWDVGYFIGELLLYKTYLASRPELVFAKNKHYLSIDDAIRLLLATYLKLVKNDEALRARIVKFTTVKLFLCIYEYVVDEPDSKLDGHLKALIALFYDMIHHPQIYQTQMMPQ